MEELQQEEHDLKEETQNDTEVEAPTQKKPELADAAETFHYVDKKSGKEILIGSVNFDAFQLAELARQFLGLPPPTQPQSKSTSYTG